MASKNGGSSFFKINVMKPPNWLLRSEVAEKRLEALLDSEMDMFKNEVDENIKNNDNIDSHQMIDSLRVEDTGTDGLQKTLIIDPVNPNDNHHYASYIEDGTVKMVAYNNVKEAQVGLEERIELKASIILDRAGR